MKLIIFGAGENADLAQFYFHLDTPHRVSAFVVDDAYAKEPTFKGLPLIPRSELTRAFPPSEYQAFIAVGYTRMNYFRLERYTQLKEMGYSMASYVSPRCSRFTEAIGDNCFILEDNTIQPFVRIGNNVVLWSGNHVGHHSTIGDHCFITSHVVISGGVTVGAKCFLGVNATLRDHITLGESTMVGAGAVVTRDTEPMEVIRAPKSESKTFKTNELTRI
jgi:sugar O-acyltransferase (sialic acid O-acetyltransferase NeuD family)